MFIDTEENDEMWNKIVNFLDNNKNIIKTKIYSEYSGNTTAFVSKEKHKRVALIDYSQGSYGVMTV